MPRFKPWPRFPEITRDMALILEDPILWKEIEEEVLSLKEPLIEHVELFDYYRGKPIPEGKKNLGVRIHYRSSEKTLSDELVSSIHEKLLKQVLEKFGATLREK
jgi:phenylalanyl-tRNA synthetase beta chain